MSDDINIGINAQDNASKEIDAVATALSEFAERARGMSKDVGSMANGLEKLERRIANLGQSSKTTNTSLAQTAKEVTEGSKAWGAFTAAVKQAEEAEKAGFRLQSAKAVTREVIMARDAAREYTREMIKARAAAGSNNRVTLSTDASRNRSTPAQYATWQKEEYEGIKRYNAELEKTTAAQAAAAGTAGQFQGRLTTLRYAIFDVSQVLAVSSAAVLGFGVIALKSAIDAERAFADVIRTTGVTGEAATRLRDDFKALAQSMPVSFRELSEIGSLAGQLNIANKDVQSFTRSVAMFGATTDVSIEDAATAFGRLDALLPDIQGNFEALGSSILKVGVNSVATESQIIAITTQLAGVGRQVNLTSDEIIGLSAALASVGIAPELARGTITRLFGQISRAVTAGGETLKDFATISRMSSEEFAEGWRSNAMDTLVQLLRGLKERGGEAEAALRSVGITASRDTPALLRLSQTVEGVLVPSLAEAADGSQNATELMEQYGIIADTAAEKLNILSNSMNLLMAELGGAAGALGGVLDILNQMVVGFTRMLEMPVVGEMAQFGVVLTVVAGAVGLLYAGFLRLVGGALAVRTSMVQLGMASTQGAIGLGAMARAAVGIGPAAAGAATGIRGLSAAIAGPLGIALAAGVTALTLHSAALSEHEAKVKAFADTFDEVSGMVTNRSREMVAELFATKGAVDKGFLNGLFGTAPDMSVYEAAEKLGLSLKTVTDAALGNVDAITQVNTALEGFTNGSRDALEAREKLNLTEQEALSAARLVRVGIEESNVTHADAVEYKRQMADANEDLIGSEEDLGAAVESTTDEIQQQIDLIFQGTNDTYALESALNSLGEAFYTSGSSAAANGSEMQKVIELIVSSSGDTATAAARMMGFYQSLIDGGHATEVELIQLLKVIDALKAAAGDVNIVPQQFDVKPLTTGFQKATTAARSTAKAAKEARQEIRTLLDYGSDLAKVFGRAFQLRFGNQSAMDKITQGWLDLAEATRQAEQELRDIQATITGLQGDRAVTEYFLSIAEAFGNDVRAAVLRGELAEIDAKIAKETQNLADVNSELSRELEGNSQAAINNRGTIQDLLGAYQDLIVEYANNGMSQEELRRKTEELKRAFIDQATQAGYSKGDIDAYAQSFADMGWLIGQVPRNITVSANVNPAIQALNELQAKAREVSGQQVYGPQVIPSPSVEKEARRLGLYKDIAYFTHMLSIYSPSSLQAANTRSNINSILTRLQSGNYRDGGIIRGPGTGRSDSVPINASQGEFIVNAKATSQNRALLEALNSGASITQIGGGSTSGNGVMMVTLAPEDRALLRNIGGSGEVVLYADGEALARSVNDGNRQIVAKGGRP